MQAKLLAPVPERTVPICRYFAACNAVLAGCGKGADADKLEEAERSRLRHQALAWLQEEVRLNRQLIQKGTPDKRRRSLLSDWQKDEDLASVREPKELAKLPEAERQAWQQLWSEVKEIAGRVPSRIPSKAP